MTLVQKPYLLMRKRRPNPAKRLSLFGTPPTPSKLAVQPRPRKAPMPPRRSFRNAQRLGGLLVRKPAEEPQLDEGRRIRVFLRQFRKRLVYLQQRFIIRRHRHFQSLQLHPFGPGTPLQRQFLPRPIDQDPAHGLGRGSEEMLASLETWIRLADQAKPGLVDERSRLKSLPRLLVRQALPGQVAQFLINVGEQFVRGLRVTAADGIHDACHLTHDRLLLVFPPLARIAAQRLAANRRRPVRPRCSKNSLWLAILGIPRGVRKWRRRAAFRPLQR